MSVVANSQLASYFQPVGYTQNGLQRFVYKSGTPLEMQLELSHAPTTPQEYFELALRVKLQPESIRYFFCDNNNDIFLDAIRDGRTQHKVKSTMWVSQRFEQSLNEYKSLNLAQATKAISTCIKSFTNLEMLKKAKPELVSLFVMLHSESVARFSASLFLDAALEGHGEASCHLVFEKHTFTKNGQLLSEIKFPKELISVYQYEKLRKQLSCSTIGLFYAVKESVPSRNVLETVKLLHEEIIPRLREKEAQVADVELDLEIA